MSTWGLGSSRSVHGDERGMLRITLFRQTVKKLDSTENLKKNWKTEFRDLVNFKLLLNRNDLEKKLYMKKMRLEDIYPTVYHLLYSDERFRKNCENTLAATRRSPHHF